VYKCFENARRIGAQAIQIFGASPRSWKATLPTAEIVTRYQTEERESGIGLVFLHAAYLVNLGTSRKQLWYASITSLTFHLQIAEALGAQGLIFHIGSSNGGDKGEANRRVAAGMKKVLEAVPGKTQLIMENGAAGGSKLGATPEEIGEIFRLVKNPRVKVCLDTQHAFAAGVIKTYSEEEIDALAKRCQKSFGIKHVVVIHANDSKTESGSFNDKHENIGAGKIGLDAFKRLANHKHFGQLPWILEVPGFANEGPDKRNVEILKKI